MFLFDFLRNFECSPAGVGRSVKGLGLPSGTADGLMRLLDFGPIYEVVSKFLLWRVFEPLTVPSVTFVVAQGHLMR